MCKVPYLEAIGSLNYLAVATQPNAQYIILSLASSPVHGRVHWEAVKHVDEPDIMVQRCF